jgi:hypothetical protein
MKAILTFLGLCLFNICYSQPPLAGEHLYNSDIDKFEGTWKWTSGNSELIIQLKKVHYLLKAGYYEDIIMGVHRFTDGAVIIEDKLAEFPMLGQNHKGSIFLWSEGVSSNPNKISGGLKDPIKNKEDNLVLLYIASTPATLTWNLFNFDGPKVQKNREPPIDNSFTLPQNITLIKQ